MAPLCPPATNASTKCGSRRRLLLFDLVPPTTTTTTATTATTTTTTTTSTTTTTTTTTATTKRCYKRFTLLRKPLPSTCSCHPLHIFRDHLTNCTHSQMSLSRKHGVHIDILNQLFEILMISESFELHLHSRKNSCSMFFLFEWCPFCNIAENC